MKRAPRLDTTQHAIVDALLAAGYKVQTLAQVGAGCPDLLISRDRRMWLIECKSPGGKLTPMQERWIDTWADEVYVCETPEQALAACQPGSGIAIPSRRVR